MLLERCVPKNGVKIMNAFILAHTSSNPDIVTRFHKNMMTQSLFILIMTWLRVNTRTRYIKSRKLQCKVYLFAVDLVSPIADKFDRIELEPLRAWIVLLLPRAVFIQSADVVHLTVFRIRLEPHRVANVVRWVGVVRVCGRRVVRGGVRGRGLSRGRSGPVWR